MSESNDATSTIVDEGAADKKDSTSLSTFDKRCINSCGIRIELLLSSSTKVVDVDVELSSSISANKQILCYGTFINDVTEIEGRGLVIL